MPHAFGLQLPSLHHIFPSFPNMLSLHGTSCNWVMKISFFLSIILERICLIVIFSNFWFYSQKSLDTFLIGEILSQRRERESKEDINPESSFVVVQSLSHVWLCDPMDYRMPGFLILHHLLEHAQTHVHWVSDAIQPLSSPSPPAFNLSQHQGLFRWVSSSHQVKKVLEFQLQPQSFQWIPRTNLL